jgi:hypothetical protein
LTTRWSWGGGKDGGGWCEARARAIGQMAKTALGGSKSVFVDHPIEWVPHAGVSGMGKNKAIGGV